MNQYDNLKKKREKATLLYQGARSFYFGVIMIIAVVNVIFHVINFSFKGLLGSILMLLVVLFLIGKMADDKQEKEEETDPLLEAADMMINSYDENGNKIPDPKPKKEPETKISNTPADPIIHSENQSSIVQRKSLIIKHVEKES